MSKSMASEWFRNALREPVSPWSLAGHGTRCDSETGTVLSTWLTVKLTEALLAGCSWRLGTGLPLAPSRLASSRAPDGFLSLAQLPALDSRISGIARWSVMLIQCHNTNCSLSTTPVWTYLALVASSFPAGPSLVDPVEARSAKFDRRSASVPQIALCFISLRLSHRRQWSDPHLR